MDVTIVQTSYLASCRNLFQLRTTKYCREIILFRRYGICHAEEIQALRPLDIHTGDYHRAQNGYRRKGGMFRLSCSKISVQQKIDELDTPSRTRCQTAYDFVMDTDQSSYKVFVDKRDREHQTTRFNLYDYDQRQGVECCIWPHLYPFTSWCETTLDGRASRLSSKMSFMTKVKSEIADYGITHELLHFHYDLWLWQTVSGAIAQGKKKKCSPNRALQDKTFSTEYWRWQHRYLIDAVNQFNWNTRPVHHHLSF